MYLVLFAIAILLSGGCASLSSSEVITEDGLTDLRSSVDEYIDRNFVDEVGPALKAVGVTFQKEISIPIIGDDVVGYYNPVLDHITIKWKAATSDTCLVHEMLHRIWFRNLWASHRWSFWWDLDAVLADPNEKEFGDRVRARLKHRHWLNTLFAETTEIYSDIGEDIVNGVVVPERLRRHYKGILRRADPGYVSSQKDLEAQSKPPANPPADSSPDSLE